ncbi:unnamed protein product [Urochloa decumbens]|uniref:Uncharacterized protein n=1 Tax=Urochloa decumbens TaxID=240449 RepID=A0ABC9C2Q8_9POAL
MAQWSTAASLDRWMGPRSCTSPPPWKAPVPAVPQRRRPARRTGRIGCASVPRELGPAAEAEQAALPVFDGDTEVSNLGAFCSCCPRCTAWSLPLPNRRLMLPCCIFVACPKEEGVACDACGGAGWMLCDFCKGKKNNVKSDTSRVYRRCPTCKAAGFILCPRCRVYKCITYPESNES